MEHGARFVRVGLEYQSLLSSDASARSLYERLKPTVPDIEELESTVARADNERKIVDVEAW